MKRLLLAAAVLLAGACSSDPDGSSGGEGTTCEGERCAPFTTHVSVAVDNRTVDCVWADKDSNRSGFSCNWAAYNDG